jgi:flagellar P-ring protein precursor FlgI
MRRLFASFILLLSTMPAGAAMRLKDLANFEGVRDNQLLGYGLVVGLAGTGDKRQTVFSAQSLTNMLERMGISVPPSAILVRNTAAVMVTANLPPFAQPGSRIDVTVAAIGDATNLQGGMLLLAPLRGPDGQVYGVAQGQVVTAGFVAGRGGNSQTVNHPTAGRVPSGAIVEKAPPTVLGAGPLKLNLKQADFTTAARVAAAINKKLGEAGQTPARAENAAVISIDPPAPFASRTVELIAELENLTIDADRTTKVVVNERTGTIVMGKDVRIAPVAILQGSLAIEIQTTYAVSQPAALASGETVVTPQVGVGVKEDKAKNVVLKQGATIEDLVKALTSIGSTARDIIAILQNLKAAGALEAELEVI